MQHRDSSICAGHGYHASGDVQDKGMKRLLEWEFVSKCDEAPLVASNEQPVRLHALHLLPAAMIILFPVRIENKLGSQSSLCTKNARCCAPETLLI